MRCWRAWEWSPKKVCRSRLKRVYGQYLQPLDGAAAGLQLTGGMMDS